MLPGIGGVWPRASASNAAFADFKEALESIENYEFDEE